MKIIFTNANTYILRFDKGDEVISGLISFAQEQNITAAVFSAIGACREVTLAFYDLGKKEYLDKTMTEDHEIVSVTGNIGRMDGKPLIHAHGVFSDKNYITHGGHIKQIIVSATCEVTLSVLEGELERGLDEVTGLNLLK